MFGSFHLPITKQQNNSGIKKGASKVEKKSFNVPDKGIYEFMGYTDRKILDILGKPERVDPTQYGYDWWIYGKNTENYLQVGIKEHHVVSIYALGNRLHTAPFRIGTHSDNLYKKMTMSDTISLKYKGTRVQFELSEDEMMIRPLIAFGNGWVQLYFDHFTNKLMCLRYVNTDTLIKLRPYTLVYRGKLRATKQRTDTEWLNIERGEEQEVFAITNILRKRHGLSTLRWHPSSARVASIHSKEMKVAHYFSHKSQKGGSLSDRLQHEGITFTTASENIAANYVDGIAASVGWMNSEGHRKNVLNKLVTHVGIGIYHNYYTQDFLTPTK